ncbi:DUF2382 domain-containing protein [Arsenicicoccus sp. oral taxon 190]|uniref:DUF2382 domain-containing protein n=1 Tax=Arsenicicoccus sp. oral taxon 190 TaxID=1658671 RepID=UPI00067A19FD|nr:PRC and DUF2382 domain-containing protein [Arsenicicoccus sp. oral taxon 190]AKT50711.1 hypothetical protein ADJ73_04225 [Arsenicicoccus sp. oral taxon 190]
MVSNEHIEQILGGVVVDNNGDKIGKVGDVYNDDRTGRPSWVTVNTGLFGTAHTFIPLDDAQVEGDTVRVPFSKDKVKDAPRVDADRHLDADEERELYRYYGRDYDEGYDDRRGVRDHDGDADAGVAGTAGLAGRRDDHGADHGADGDADAMGRGGDHGADGDADAMGRGGDHGADGDADARRGVAGRGDGTMTRSEEELRVGTREREAGTVRLRKHVRTERETVDVPVTHEEVRVERTPIRDGQAGNARIGDGETAEVRLREEEVVVDKDVVAKEQVSLGKERVTENQRVTEDVRKEEIEVEREGGVRGTDAGRGGVGNDRDYDNDGKVGLGDKIKDKLDRDNDGKVGS